MNGRELTAEDVIYTLDRFGSEKGNANRAMLAALDQVEALDKYTVKFTLKESYAWFLDGLEPDGARYRAQGGCREDGGPEEARAAIGTGPWMLDSYRPNVGMTLVRNPTYFLPGLPNIDRIEVMIDEDNASRIAAFMTGKYDLGFEFSGTINASTGCRQGHAEAAVDGRHP